MNRFIIKLNRKITDLQIGEDKRNYGWQRTADTIRHTRKLHKGV